MMQRLKIWFACVCVGALISTGQSLLDAEPKEREADTENDLDTSDSPGVDTLGKRAAGMTVNAELTSDLEADKDDKRSLTTDSGSLSSTTADPSGEITSF